MKTLKGQVKSSQVKSSGRLITLCRPECKQSLSESFDIAVIDDIAVIYRPIDAEAQKCRLDQFTINWSGCFDYLLYLLGLGLNDTTRHFRVISGKFRRECRDRDRDIFA